MKIKNIKWLAFIAAILAFVFVFSACSSAESQNSGQVQVVYPTVYITQFVTQVVTTREAPAEHPAPAVVNTPVPASAANISTGFDPFAVPIYYPLMGCAASRLHVGDVASIQYSAKNIGLYHYKSLAFEPDLRYLP